jgi:hypothetical protein
MEKPMNIVWLATPQGRIAKSVLLILVALGLVLFALTAQWA